MRPNMVQVFYEKMNFAPALNWLNQNLLIIKYDASCLTI